MQSPTLAYADLAALIEQSLDEARAAGASQADVGLSVDTGLSVTVRLGEVETLEYQRDRGMGITVYVGKKKGTATTGDLSWQAIADTVRKAVSIAKFTAEDDCAGLPDPDTLAREVPDLALSHPWDLEAEGAIDLARRCESAALARDPRITNSEGGSVGAHRGLRVYGNSLGFLGGYPNTYYSVSCVVMGQQDGEMERDYWYTAARDWRELEDVESVGRTAAERAVARLGARRIPTTRAPVLFVPELARGLIGHFIGAIRGGAQYRQSSFLLGAAGRQLFPEFFGISERPHLARGLGSAPFDGEGCATHDRELVSRGVLDGYVLNTYSARKLGLKTTGNAGGVHNLLVHPGEDDYASLLKRLGRGLIVTELMGQGVNGVTGDYSRGAAGLWVEGGEARFPVSEITIAGNLKSMFRNLVAVGRDVDARGSIRTGSMLIDEMTIAGE
ncbi:MAG TPA: metalloprotease PmbA [Steroidobacteraceae bacterium]|nr:metalloprotease PmbA [Steroidobacteraceae bacterium]